MKTTKFNPYQYTRKENYSLQCELYEKYLSEKEPEKRAEYSLMMDKLAKAMCHKLFKV
jgi:hypothetical protein